VIRLGAPLLVLLAALDAAAQGALDARAGSSMRDIGEALAAGQCSRAAGALERAMLRDDPEALLAAGWLSERGLCLRRDADKAWAYYEKAYAAGARKSALRLAGLAATVEGGQDVAATLWWGRRMPQAEGGSGGGSCDPLPDRAQVTEGEFVDALKAWPQEKLAFCRAWVGFLGLINAELRYPTRASFLDLRGEVLVEYALHEGRIEVRAGPRGADEIFLQLIRQLAGDAMARIPRPTTPVTGKVQYVFTIE
jgi:hypothetical protein